jgi:hypothetical protein
MQLRLQPFADESRQFISWAKGDSSEPMDLRHALIRVLAIYRAALDLPSEYHAEASAEPLTRNTTDAALERVRQRVRLLPFDLYRSVFDPIFENDADNEPVMCSIGDDIEEIFRDVAEGLQLFDENLALDACWSWGFNFRTHWSRHAVNALQGLNAHWEHRS